MQLRISLCILLLLPAVVRSQPADKETVKFIQSLQNGDGGFLPAPQDPRLDQAPRSGLRATTAANRALEYFGGELPNKEKVVKYVASCFDEKSGGFADVPQGTPAVVATAIGLMAIVELDMPRKPYQEPATAFLIKNVANFEDARIAVAGFEAVKKHPPEEVIRKWLEYTSGLANKDGTYGKGDGKTRDTGSVVAMKLRMGLAVEGTDALEAALFNGQREDGAFGKAGARGSDLETTYRVVRAIHMLKGNPKDVAKLREFIGKCRNKDGGYGMAPGQPSTVAGTYFAGIIYHWLK